ncbi:winged helix-turn-helix transcriptional regulator [Brucella thiophenivorans]|nr:helix-turn-helix domain-containing protein [Brucella thiophenivorans]
MREQKSGCPINQAMEVVGDRWSLIILRDMMFGGHRHYRALLENSLEGIASNILAARLRRLVELRLVTRNDDGHHKQKVRYSMTEKAIELLPVVVAVGAWGRKFCQTTPELAIRARLLEEGGPEMWAAFMDELRDVHLGQERQGETTAVIAALTDAYKATVEKSSHPG